MKAGFFIVGWIDDFLNEAHKKTYTLVACKKAVKLLLLFDFF